jgi:hypothetical protein
MIIVSLLISKKACCAWIILVRHNALRDYTAAYSLMVAHAPTLMHQITSFCFVPIVLPNECLLTSYAANGGVVGALDCRDEIAPVTVPDVALPDSLVFWGGVHSFKHKLPPSSLSPILPLTLLRHPEIFAAVAPRFRIKHTLALMIERLALSMLELRHLFRKALFAKPMAHHIARLGRASHVLFTNAALDYHLISLFTLDI